MLRKVIDTKCIGRKRENSEGELMVKVNFTWNFLGCYILQKKNLLRVLTENVFCLTYFKVIEVQVIEIGGAHRGGTLTFRIKRGCAVLAGALNLRPPFSPQQNHK